MIQLFASLISFFVGLLVIPIIIKIISKKNLLDKPGGRKIHKEAIPSMGGIGIFLAMVVGLAFSLNFEELSQIRFLLLGCGVMFVLGLQDDLVELTPLQKLLGQLFAVSIVVVLGDIRISSFYGFLGVGTLPLWLSYSLTIFTVVGLTNAFNLVDGLDGLAGTLSLISFVFLGGWFLLTGFSVYGVLALSVSGGILAFMVYNWHPAKIFMGDTGSLTIGFLMAILAIVFVETNGVILNETHYLKFQAPITAGLALVLVSCIDTLRVFIKRIRNGKPPLAADKSHVHHFLMRMNMGHDQVAIVLGLIKLGFLFLVISFASYSDNLLLPLVIGSVVGLCLFLDAVTLKKVKKIAKSSPRILDLGTSQNMGMEQRRHREKSMEKEPA